MGLSSAELSKLAGGKGILDLTPEDINQMAVGRGPFFLLDRQIDYLAALKGEVQAGRLPLLEYLDIAEGTGKTATNLLNTLTTQGSKSASEAHQRIPALRQFVTLNTGAGQGDFESAKVPFTRTEMPKLPQNVLPSQEELAAANIPVDWFPAGTKFRVDPAPQVNPGPGGAGGNVTAPGGQTVQVPDPANPGKFINVPLVGDPLKDSVSKSADQVRIEQEAARQAEQSRLAFEAERAIRGQRLTDLSALLTQEENRKFSLAQPEVFEDLNTRGLLRSSGLGEALAREKAKLAGESANVLAQQGLTDRDAEISGIKDILARTQQFQTSGLERAFTLEDFKRESEQARALGAQYAPTVKTGNSVLSGVLGGGLSGASSGAAIGSVVPGIGTGIGAGIGAILGAGSGAASGKGK